MKTLIIVVLFLVLQTSGFSTQYWNAFKWSPELGTNPVESGPDSITFTWTDSGLLSQNTYAVQTAGGSSATRWEIHIEGQSVHFLVPEENGLVLDPFAHFVGDTYASGHTEWSPDTPLGYQATLYIGAYFPGCNPRTYQSLLWGEPVGEPVTGTVVMKEYAPFIPPYYETYWRVEHQFDPISYAGSTVPEPTSIIPLVLGTLALALKRRWLRASAIRSRRSLFVFVFFYNSFFKSR